MQNAAAKKNQVYASTRQEQTIPLSGHRDAKKKARLLPKERKRLNGTVNTTKIEQTRTTTKGNKQGKRKVLHRGKGLSPVNQGKKKLRGGGGENHTLRKNDNRIPILSIPENATTRSTRYLGPRKGNPYAAAKKKTLRSRLEGTTKI